MRHVYLNIRDLKDRDGENIPYHVQILAFLIWTAPERDLTMREYRKIFRRVGEMFGCRIGPLAAWRFTRNTALVDRVTRSWLRPVYYLNDLQMDRRQRTVFKEGLRGTGFDKMDRIFRRAYDAEQYRDMGRETCDVEALFRELPDMDLSVIMEDWESQQPRHFRVVKGNDVRLIKMSNP
jgi:hypothetical protein